MRRKNYQVQYIFVNYTICTTCTRDTLDLQALPGGILGMLGGICQASGAWDAGLKI